MNDIEAEPWMEDALCSQLVDADLFFPEKGETNKPAKRICASCDVAAQCLEYALRNDERFGIWGGTSERERRHMFEPRSRAFTPAEDERIKYLAERGDVSNVEIARQLGRAVSAIRKRRSLLSISASTYDRWSR